jgi:hypothetical protein
VEIREEVQEGRNQNVFDRILGWIRDGWRIFFLYYVGQAFWDRTSYVNILAILFVVACYYAIDFFKKRNPRHPPNPQPQPPHPHEPTLTAWLLEKTCLSVEMGVSFCLSFFPNWDIQMHRQWVRGLQEKYQ